LIKPHNVVSWPKDAHDVNCDVYVVILVRLTTYTQDTFDCIWNLLLLKFDYECYCSFISRDSIVYNPQMNHGKLKMENKMIWKEKY
jgi:hypothetical protein